MRRFHGFAEIDADHVGAVRSRVVERTAEATAGVEPDFARKNPGSIGVTDQRKTSSQWGTSP